MSDRPLSYLKFERISPALSKSRGEASSLSSLARRTRTGRCCATNSLLIWAATHRSPDWIPISRDGCQTFRSFRSVVRNVMILSIKYLDVECPRRGESKKISTRVGAPKRCVDRIVFQNLETRSEVYDYDPISPARMPVSLPVSISLYLRFPLSLSGPKPNIIGARRRRRMFSCTAEMPSRSAPTRSWPPARPLCPLSVYSSPLPPAIPSRPPLR